jgi:RecA-family ATPase
MSAWDEGADLLATIRTGTWLDAQTFPALAWAVPGIVPEGFGLLVGPPKLGKSWMALHLGLACASGSQAFGAILTGPPRAVLYLALEDGERRLQDRCRKLLDGTAIPESFHYATQVEAARVLATIDAWLDEHHDGNPLVILDTLGKVMPSALPGESAYARDYRVGTGIKRLSDRHRGATVLVVHHTRKQEGADWMDSTSGTQGLNGSADFTIALTRSRNDTEAVLRVTGRDVRENEFAMVIEDGRWTLAGKSLTAAAQAVLTARASAGLKDRSADVVALVSQHPEGVRAKDAADALGINEDQSRVYLARLFKAGRIDKPEPGLYTPTTTVTGVTGVTDPDDGRNTRNTSNTHLAAFDCYGCGEPLDAVWADVGTHPGCEVA